MHRNCGLDTLLKTSPAVQRLVEFLSVKELVRLSCTCQAWKQAVFITNNPFFNDISGGVECRSVTCNVSLPAAVSAITSRVCEKTAQQHSNRQIVPGADFQYTGDNVLPRALGNYHDPKGCCCSPQTDCSISACCTCASAVRPVQDHASPLRTYAAWECGPACSCGTECSLKLTQQGLAVEVQLVKSCKGWSAVVCEDILQGSFVAQYAGEVINKKEAERRLKAYDADIKAIGHALLVVRETLPSGNACLRMNIDATVIGNVARFFNHSCDGGNLSLEVVRSRGCPMPHVALYANRDIKAGEELTFSYGTPCSGPSPRVHIQSGAADAGIQSTPDRRRQCFCGSSACLGYLPGV